MRRQFLNETSFFILRSETLLRFFHRLALGKYNDLLESSYILQCLYVNHSGPVGAYAAAVRHHQDAPRRGH